MKKAVKKPASTIHVDSRHISIVQRKLFNLMLWQYYRAERKDVDVYTIDMSMIHRYLKYNTRTYPQIVKTVEKLSEVKVKWDLLSNTGSREVGFCVLVSQCWCKDGILHYSFPSRLKELIDDQRIYAILKLNIVSLFKSKFALSLYENCYRFVGTGTTGWWDIETFKQLVGAQDVKLYDSFGELRRRVIIPAVKEVNDVSDIILNRKEIDAAIDLVSKKKKEKKDAAYDPECQTEGRKVVAIRFSVEKKKEVVRDILPDDSIIESSSPTPPMTDAERENNKRRLEGLMKMFDK